MNYQRSNGLAVDGIVGDETWKSITNKKKKKDENASFIESLKTKSGGWYYDRIQSIRKAQRDLGIMPSGDIDDKSDSEEDFHKRVRKRWENPVQVKPMSEESDNKKIKFSIDEKRKLGFLPEPEVESIFPDYSEGKSPYMEAFEKAEKEAKKLEIPKEVKDEETFPGWGSDGRIMPTEDDGEWQNNPKYEEFKNALVDIAAAKTEGIIKPGYNAEGKWSEDPDADNYGKDSAKYKLLKILNSTYPYVAPSERLYIEGTAYNLRNFDETAICEAYYMNNSSGAGTAGHAAILLVNSNGEGILFSYGAANKKDISGGPARMNIGIYKGSGLENMIAEGEERKAISTTGEIVYERYNRWQGHEISAINGKRMFEKAIDITANLKNYDLLKNNCDQTAVEILNAGGINYKSKILPNFTYLSE